MSDDRTLDSRVNRLETSQAALNQRVTDLGEQVVLLAPLAVSAAELRKDVKGVETDLSDMKAEFSRGLEVMHQRITKRDEAAARRDEETASNTAADRRSLRTSLIALTAMVGAALITALGGVIVALLASQ